MKRSVVALVAVVVSHALLVSSVGPGRGCHVLRKGGKADRINSATVELFWEVSQEQAGSVGVSVKFRAEIRGANRPITAVAVGLLPAGSGGFIFGGDTWDVVVASARTEAEAEAAGEDGMGGGFAGVRDSHFSRMRVRPDETEDIRDTSVEVDRATGSIAAFEFTRDVGVGEGRAGEDVRIDLEVGQPVLWAIWDTPGRSGEHRPADMAVNSEVVRWTSPSEDCGRPPAQQSTDPANDFEPRAVIEPSCSTPQRNGTYSSPGGEILLRWSLVPPDNSSMEFQLTARTTGWVSVGVNTVCSMVSADKVVGWVSDVGGVVTIFDAWATGHVTPSTDTALGGTDDVSSASGWQNGTHTFLQWTRKLVTGDSFDDPITYSLATLAWAIGSADGSAPGVFPQHAFGSHGCQTMFFLTQCSSPVSTSLSSASVTSGGSTRCPGAGDITIPGGKFAISWEMTSDLKFIDFTMIGRTTGWVSIGLHDQFGMAGSDKYTGWVTAAGQAVVLDTHADGRALPPLDTALGGRDDVANISGTQNATHTTLRFRRPLDTGDLFDMAIADRKIWLHWAIGANDGTLPNSIAVHSTQDFGGVPDVNFFVCRSVPPAFPEGIFLKDAGQGLSLTVAGALLIFSALFWTRRGLGRATAYDPLPESKSGVRVQGSQIEMPELAIVEVTGGGEAGSSLAVSDAVAEWRQSTATSAANRFGALWVRRIGGMWPAWSIVVAALYVLANVAWGVAWVLIWPVAGTKPGALERVARVLGHLVAANLLISVLPATRNSLLVVLTGESFERTVMLHRWVGWLTAALIVLHMSIWFIVRGAAVVVVSGVVQLNQVYSLTGLLCCAIIIGTSVSVVRRKAFNLFYFAHFAFVPLFILAFLHNAKFMPFFIAACVIYGIDRAFRLLWGTIPRRSSEVTLLADGLVRIRWPRHPLARYEPGQYVFLNFPQLGLLEWHPFSLTSGSREASLEVNAKSSGNFTAKLAEFARSHAQGNATLWVRADGPYGHFMIPVKNYPVLLLISNGIGVTPMASIVRDVFGVCGDGVRVPGSRQRWPRLQHLYFHWGVPTLEQYSWFGQMLEESDRVSKAEAAGGGVRLSMCIHVSSKEVDVPLEKPFTSGRMNVAEVIGACVQAHPGSPIGVCVCGVPRVVKDAWDACVRHKSSGKTVEVHFETFLL